MVLKELILDKIWVRTFFPLNLGGCGNFQSTDFQQFLLWEGWTVLKGLILDNFYFGSVWCLIRTDFR